MPVNLAPPDATTLLPVAGLRLGVAEANVRKPNRKDLLLIELAPGSSVAGVFTSNRFSAAPVQVCRKHLEASPRSRALVINTGCANAGTGAEGIGRAVQVCIEVAKLIGCDVHEVLPFSTGVILEQLPSERVVAGLPRCVADLSADNWADAAQAIMTTDTAPKAVSARVTIDGKPVTITGISKGAGMIEPNMATMLAFVATDAKIAPTALRRLTQRVADASFNRIVVDGDQSTNDSFIVMATGASGVELFDNESDDLQHARDGAFLDALQGVATRLAQAIVRDGEGATKFISINVNGGRNEAECLKIAKAIGKSPLVKTAFFASDPNLGRILAAIGYAGVDDLDVSEIDVYLGDVLVAKNGGRAPTYSEAQGVAVMKPEEITVRVELNRGDASTTVWTCDFSFDYVKINAEYRS